MFRNKIRTALLALGPALLLAFGLYALFALRIQTGDVYPAYSSLRADPLGTKILFESLREIPALHVRRNVDPLDALQAGEGSCALFLGAQPFWLSSRMEKIWLELAMDGARVVISFSHAKMGEDRYAAEEDEDAGEDNEKIAETNEWPFTASETGKWASAVSRARTHWGVEFKMERRGETNDAPDAAAEPLSGHPEFKPAPWASALFFAPVSNVWKTLYAREGRPVLIERALGRGALVLASDSYLFSNEALMKERQPALIARLLGPGRRIIFDESHLGIQKTESVMTLVWKYRLHGLAAGLILLAALFLWKSFARFLPVDDAESAAGESVAGMNSHEGYIQLLRRSVSVRELPRTCLDEWGKTCGRDPRNRRKLERMAEKLQPWEGAPARHAEDAHRMYKEMSNIAKERE